MQDALDAAEGVAASRAVARGEMETLTSEETAAFTDAATPLSFWRAKRGLTQTDLATAAGISQSYVASLESGTRKGDPVRLARALNVPMEAIIDPSEQDASKRSAGLQP
jgi:DNA-binding XRE family transcriptional regulator